MTVHFESEALEEYRDAVLYSEERFGLGEVFVRAVEAALDAILSDPERFQSVGDGVRVFRMKRFPYYLFYHHSPESKSIVIYALAHHSRKRILASTFAINRTSRDRCSFVIRPIIS